MRKQIIVYDPRITKEDIQSAEENSDKIKYYFRPTNKSLSPKLYDQPQYDEIRLKYFINCLRDTDSTLIIPMLIPFIRDKMMNRNK